MGIGLGGGVSGIILYLVNRFDMSMDSDIKDIVQTKLDYILSTSSAVKNNISILNGVSGIGWFTEYLTGKSPDYDYNFNASTDNHLIKLIEKNGDVPYEYINGLAGVAVYARRRAEKNKNNKLYQVVFDRFIEKSIITDEKYCCWNTEIESYLRKDKENASKLEVDFGLAHGNLGVVAAMEAYASHDIYREQSELIINNAFNWYERHKLYNCYFDYPSKIEVSKVNRLAWCYGDLTTSYNLLRAGIKIKNKDIVYKALATARKTTKRRLESSFVVDAPICHGSAGVALIYNLLNEISPSDEFLLAEGVWFDSLMRTYLESGLEGLSFQGVNKKEQNLGLLEGLAGIGLTILALKESKKDWLDLILLK